MKAYSIFRAIHESVGSVITNLWGQLVLHADFLCVLIIMLNPFISIGSMVAYPHYTAFDALIISILLTIAAMMLVALFNHEKRKPSQDLKKRYTKVNKYGDVEIDSADLNSAIIKLYELENKEDGGAIL